VVAARKKMARLEKEKKRTAILGMKERKKKLSRGALAPTGRKRANQLKTELQRTRKGGDCEKGVKKLPRNANPKKNSGGTIRGRKKRGIQGLRGQANLHATFKIQKKKGRPKK